VFWPKDLLPDALPNVRIYSWGYDADIWKLMSSVGLNTVHRHARNLLNDLAALRDELEDRKLPLIFVAHNLGGLVVKDALNQSAGEVGNKRLGDILPATFGVCFLGTPHRGSKAASILRKVCRVTEIFAGQRANTQLLRALEKNSETLERLTKGFYDTLKKHEGLQIFSFLEEREVRKFGVISIVIVDPDSAQVGHGSEETGSIPANNWEMVRFTSTRDTGFVRIKNVLNRWVGEIQSAATRKF